MSDVVIDCPPTPEHVSNCPTPPMSTKTRIRDFIQKQLMATDVSISDNEVDGDENQREAAGSPPPNCSICLGQINSKCFTDSCLHTFCFSCLLEWSKIKAECPLCKQAFKSIIHNVKSMDKYEEYKVESYRCTNWATIANQFEQFLLATSFPAFRTRIHRQRGSEYNAIPSAERTSTSTSTGSNYSRIHQLFLNYNSLVERFAREYANDIIPLRSNGSAWRAYVYQRDLYALPLNDLSGRSRDISARFYRENPAQIHRLMGWLNREIIYLLNSTVHYISFVLQTIEERITQHDMTSRAFRLHIQPFFTRHTSHFLHELINFARSPFDIIGYDRNVQYRPHFYDTEIESVSLDSDRSDPSPRLSPRSDLSNVTAEDSYMSSESMRNNHSRSVIVFGSNGEGSSSRIFTTPASQLFQPITEPVTVDTDDSDDCLFVCEQKPPHLRTPVMVELNSEEDSDVIIVETEEINNAEPNNSASSCGSNTNQPIATSIKAELSTRHRCNSNDSLEHSNTANDGTSNNSSFQTITPIRRKRRSQPNDEANGGYDAVPSQIKMIIRSDPRSSYSSTITTGALLGDSDCTNVASVSQRNGAGPSTSVIRQPLLIRKRFKKKKYTIYEASSESSTLESSATCSSSDSSHEEHQIKKPKRLTKKQSRKTMKINKTHKIFTKKLIKMKQMIKRLQEPMDTAAGIANDLSSSSSSSDSSSSDSSSDDDEEKESPMDSSCENNSP